MVNQRQERTCRRRLMPCEVSILLFLSFMVNKFAFDSMRLLDNQQIETAEMFWLPNDIPIKSDHRHPKVLPMLTTTRQDIKNGRSEHRHPKVLPMPPTTRQASNNGNGQSRDNILSIASNHAAIRTRIESIKRNYTTSTVKKEPWKWPLDVDYYVPETPGAFLHIGKTGGSSISSQLRNGCHSWVPKPCGGYDHHIENESYASRLTTYYHTPDFHKLANQDYDFYVIGIRDPLERLISVYSYQNPKNIRFRKEAGQTPIIRDLVGLYSCFPNLEAFARLVGKDPTNYNFDDDKYSKLNTKAKKSYGDCKNLARAVINQQVRSSNHFYWGMNRVYQMLLASLDSSQVFVIRNDNLWGDWVSTNQHLGQQNVTTFPNIRVRDYRNMDEPVSKKLSIFGRRHLCLALKPEYDAYLDLLRRAENLQDHERKHSLRIANRNCPWLKLTL